MIKKKILVVDDQEDTLSVVGKRLDNAGYYVIKARNGKEALTLAKDEQPDLIILDIVMPDMAGTEIAARLKDDPNTKDIPIMFLTCLVTKKEEAVEGHEVAGSVVFAKPYNPEEFLKEIKKQIASKK